METAYNKERPKEQENCEIQLSSLYGSTPFKGSTSSSYTTHHYLSSRRSSLLSARSILTLWKKRTPETSMSRFYQVVMFLMCKRRGVVPLLSMWAARKHQSPGWELKHFPKPKASALRIQGKQGWRKWLKHILSLDVHNHLLRLKMWHIGDCSRFPN